MKGVVFLGDRTAEVRTFPDPVAGPGEVVVQLKAAGLCGSDLHGYRQSKEVRAGNTTIPGHEASGVIAALGPGVTGVEIGDRVSVYHFRTCGHCRECRAGNMMWCEERRGYGGPIDGPDADLLLADAYNCLPLPDNLSFGVGAMMACNAATAFSSISKLNLSGKDTIAIFGQGPVGLAGVLFAKALGARVISVEPLAERRRIALELGADEAVDPMAGDLTAAIKELTHGRGADAAYETAGSPASQAGVVDCLGNGGRAVFVGFGSQEKSINPSQIISRQLVLMGSIVMPIYMYFDMVQFVQEKNIDLEQLITHRFPIEQAPEAFKLFDSGNTGKVIFEWP